MYILFPAAFPYELVTGLAGPDNPQHSGGTTTRKVANHASVPSAAPSSDSQKPRHSASLNPSSLTVATRDRNWHLCNVAGNGTSRKVCYPPSVKIASSKCKILAPSFFGPTRFTSPRLCFLAAPLRVGWRWPLLARCARWWRHYFEESVETLLRGRPASLLEPADDCVHPLFLELLVVDHKLAQAIFIALLPHQQPLLLEHHRVRNLWLGEEF
mmetsp:Transcript_59004/g.120875  ORF Transcript_59004/g.120875 Transcript_59004/m.120875 type:complete len:213 (+) Transcript_59004:29-667(+)